MAKGTSFKSLAEAGIAALLIEFAKWVVPPASAIMTLVVGILQPGVPWVFTIPAAAFAFASVATGMLRYDEWTQRRTPAHKINYGGANVLFDYTRNDKGEIIGISKSQVVLLFTSAATFPLSYIVDEISTSVNGRINPHPDRPLNVLAQPNSLLQYRDSPIDMQDDAPKQNIEAHVKFTCRYGFAKKEKYTMTKDLNIICPFSLGIGYLPLNQVAADKPQR